MPKYTGTYDDIVVVAIDSNNQRFLLEPVDFHVLNPLTRVAPKFSVKYTTTLGGDVINYTAANTPLSGGAGVVTYRASTALPAGVQLDAQTGMLTGLPRAVGDYNITISVNDGFGK